MSSPTTSIRTPRTTVWYSHGVIHNSEFLSEIAESKLSYCEWIDDGDQYYDAIVQEADFNPALFEVGATVRVMTIAHIDPEIIPMNKRNTSPRSFFLPFKHYRITENGPVEVLRSHWKGGFQNGQCALDGAITRRLGEIYVELVNGIAKLPKFTNYTYKAEMIGDAILHLCENGLKFDESRGKNAHAYCYTLVKNNFVRRLNIEKKHRDIRDDLLFQAGYAASDTRQVEAEMVRQGLAEPPPIKRKAGRPKRSTTAPRS